MTAISAGCFGKLPIFADFLRHNAALAEVRELDQWLQEGLFLARESIGAGWEAEYDAAPAARFVFSPGVSTRFLAGVLVLGRDGAGRRFPFAIFAAVEAAPLRGETALIPHHFGTFLDEAESLATEGWRGLDPKSFLSRVAALGAVGSTSVADCRRRHEEFLRKEAAPFWGAIARAPGGEGVPRAAETLRGLLRPHGAPVRRRPTFGVKFPLPAETGGAGPRNAAALWLDAWICLQDSSEVPTLATWRERTVDGPAGLCIFPGPLSPRDFLHLIQPGLETDRLFDLSKQEGADSPGQDSSSKPAEGEAATTLAAWLKSLSPPGVRRGRV